ncbi:MAG: MarR family transcriptional regulator [Anaerolineae bacterium]|nr:MarR family transcriptional regulator [Anaerolineae bacterium]
MADKSTTNSSTRTSLLLWLRMLTCTRMIENQIRRQLRESFETTLPRFDVMAQLERNRDGLRMGEISKLLLVTSGNITGIIDQLVKENLVERSPDPHDRRAYQVKLTEKGIAAFDEMAILHRGWIADLNAGLSDEEQKILHGLLEKLNESLQEKI